MRTMNMSILPRINWMGYVEYKSPWIHFKRNVDEYVLYLIKSGELHIEENGLRYTLSRGDVLLLEPGLDHEGFQKHICDYYYIHFSHTAIANAEEDDLTKLAKRNMLEENDPHLQESDLSVIPKHYTITNRSTLQQAFFILNELQQLYKRRHFNRAKIALRFTELLIDLSRDYMTSAIQLEYGSSSRPFLKVHAVLAYIHQNYPQRITSAELEREFEYNFDYLNRIFSRITGHPIIQYVNLVRINRAKELLEATHLSIGEIGYLVGLNDPYYFSKVFKKYTGQSPSHYYKQHVELHRL